MLCIFIKQGYQGKLKICRIVFIYKLQSTRQQRGKLRQADN